MAYGSNYWANFDKAVRDENLYYLSVRVREIETSDHGPRKAWRVTPDDLQKGLALMAAGPDPTKPAYARPHPSHLAMFLAETDDAITADVVLQMTIFGELIYG